MNGQMMQMPLLTSSLLVHAERHHADQQIVSRRVEGDIHRYTYADLALRTRKLAKAVAALGVPEGERVATLAWNGYRHMELYYAVSGSGRVLNTINPRLHADQVVFIADHAENQVLFFDMTFLPLVESIASRVKTVRHFVALIDKDQMPASTSIPNLLCYEDLIAGPDRLHLARASTRTAASAVLHLGHHRQPQGRAVQPPLHGAAHLRRGLARQR
jgi:acyl-CoA synthetase (AMP-forming)/AMP-acid ligase II